MSKPYWTEGVDVTLDEEENITKPKEIKGQEHLVLDWLQWGESFDEHRARWTLELLTDRKAAYDSLVEETELYTIQVIKDARIMQEKYNKAVAALKWYANRNKRSGPETAGGYARLKLKELGELED